MIKQIAAAALGIFLTVSLAGCSGFPGNSGSGSREPDYESGTTEEELEGITYQVPESWGRQESEDGNTIYYYPRTEDDGLPVTVMFQYASMEPDLWEDGEMEFLRSLAAEYSTLDGVSNFEQEDSSLGSLSVVRVTCDQTTGDDGALYHARYVLIPVNEKAVLTVASAVREDAENSCQEDFDHICESIRIPEE